MNEHSIPLQDPLLGYTLSRIPTDEMDQNTSSPRFSPREHPSCQVYPALAFPSPRFEFEPALDYPSRLSRQPPPREGGPVARTPLVERTGRLPAPPPPIAAADAAADDVADRADLCSAAL
ncbi:hypothetical protein Purlil1_5993 [Purpureocillium lilacinum]|uniref:Uncharacterized protein n=1 Tax=Purpureocillium lilacinum TaxID=33203 RepID=A0ABR0C129_PURLI|nr:hypothetical protein Purlil1_5993 [Purpureocillium lilacinum]